MAGGSRKTGDQSGKFGRTASASTTAKTNSLNYRKRYPDYNNPEFHSSEHFKQRQKLEKQRIHLKSIRRLEDSVFRLLYKNLDLSEEEQELISAILSESPKAFSPATDNFNIKNFFLKTRCDVTEKSDSSPSNSEMADSGLETGSISPRETTSENSCTDLEDVLSSQDQFSTPDKTKNKSQYQFSTDGDENSPRTSLNNEQEDHITQYENQVLNNDPFEDPSDCQSEGNENSPRLQVKKIADDVENSTGSNASKGNFFIDASTLNDELEGLVLETPHDGSKKTHFTTRKATNILLDGEESLAEFEKELKLTQHLIKVSESNAQLKVLKTDKESLAVEIKEADSGESAQPSPCPDNNSSKSDKATEEIVDSQTEEKSNGLSEPEEKVPLLIRRNTFELDSTEEKVSSLRQEYERRQGNLVFQNSIPQYSGHRVDGDSIFDAHEQLEAALEDEKQFYNHPMSFSLPEKSTCFEQPEEKNSFEEEKENANKTEEKSSEELETKKVRTRRDEGTPIVSGGASSLDYTPTKSESSPIVRRKTETTPIVSGGSVIMNEKVSAKKKPPTAVSKSLSTSMTTAASWVVDMSDCNSKTEMKSSSSSSSSSKIDRMTDSFVYQSFRKKASQGNLGFFVNLNDVPSESKTKEENSEEKKQKAYCEFYIDMSDENERKKSEVPKNTNSDSKKNIFSMFIDLKGRKAEKTKEPKSREVEKGNGSSSSQSGVFMFIESDSPVVRRRALSSSSKQNGTFKRHSWNIDGKSDDGNEVKVEEKPSTSVLSNTNKFRREHKRAQSLSVDRGEFRRVFENSNNCKSSISSHTNSDETRHKKSLSFDTQQHRELFESEDLARDTPPNSHVEIINEEIIVSVQNHEFKELENSNNGCANDDEISEVSLWEKTATESTETRTRKSETFDISSGSGGSTGPSPERDNPEDFIEDPIIYSSIPPKIAETHKSLNETIKKIENELSDNLDFELEDDSKKNSSSSFVKLSDLDKRPSTAIILESPLVAKNKDSNNLGNTRMSCSIPPETSWIESKLVVSRNNIPNVNNGPIRTAFPRKFPSVMSRSLPSKQKSPLEELTSGDCAEAEGIISESDLSSMQSSMGRSGAEGSTEETETWSLTTGKPYNRLGEDLLRMFLEEINPDVTIDVSGRRIKAHKCILSSRCQYFAAILSGGWIESAGNVISLQGYSYNAVHFALCHIYSGESNIPDTISIVELATLADMLCLEGLKEVIGYTLKVKYCHLFHKPCQVCAVGVLECMPLAAAYGLDEVYRKSLRWITRHFVRIWPTKAFATLPRELMEKCYHQHIVHMSTDNVLQTMMDCDKLLATIPNVRWAEPVFRLVSNLAETSVKFLSENFTGVLGSENFQKLGREMIWNISRLEDNFFAAADRLPPEQACKSYSKLHKLLAAVQTQIQDENERIVVRENPEEDDDEEDDEFQQQPQRAHVPYQHYHQNRGHHRNFLPVSLPSRMKTKWVPVFIEFLKNIQSRVEKCLIREAPRAARTNAWLKMDLELRRRIQELACLVILPHESKRPSRHSNFMKDPKSKESASRTSASRSLDLRRVKMAISEHNDKAMKQSSATSAVAAVSATTTASATVPTSNTHRNNSASNTNRTLAKPKSDPLERKAVSSSVAANHIEKQSIDTIRPKSWPNKIEVKSRYLEPRNKPTPPRDSSTTSTAPTQLNNREKVSQQRRKIMISSSDSSRTSSPAMKRAVEKKSIAKINLPIKKDIKALSSDSLTTDPTNPTKTSIKKDATSKSCGITRPESPSLKQKAEIGLSVDSLADNSATNARQASATKQETDEVPRDNQEFQSQPRINRSDLKPIAKMDTSMSTDSLMTEIITNTPKTPNVSNKLSPTLGKISLLRAQNLDKSKKPSPPIQRKPLPRYLESSTIASRNKAAVNSNLYGSPNLRRNLLDAAKVPEISSMGNKGNNRPNSGRQSASVLKKETKNANSNSASSSRQSTDSKRSSPKLGGTRNSKGSVSSALKKTCKNGVEEKVERKGSGKCHNGEAKQQQQQQPTVGSRSGTFLKDEPTVLKKSDLKTSHIGT